MVRGALLSVVGMQTGAGRCNSIALHSSPRPANVDPSHLKDVSAKNHLVLRAADLESNDQAEAIYGPNSKEGLSIRCDVPVRVHRYHQLDTFGLTAVALMYSDHAGLAPLEEHCKRDPKAKQLWCTLSVPFSDDDIETRQPNAMCVDREFATTTQLR